MGFIDGLRELLGIPAEPEEVREKLTQQTREINEASTALRRADADMERRVEALSAELESIRSPSRD